MNSPPRNERLHDLSCEYRHAALGTLLIGASVWFVLCYPYNDLLDPSGNPLGGDFVMLYVAGQAVESGESASLYDDSLNQKRATAIFPHMKANQSWPYRYPPTVAACMAPLSMLPFGCSFVCFVAMQLLLLAMTLHLLRHTCTAIRREPNWLWAVAGCPVIVFETLVGGQSSLLAVAIVVCVVFYLRAGKPAIAGGLLALALYKPNVLVIFILACLIARPRMFFGFIPVSLLGLAVGFWTSGYQGMLDYLQLGTQLASAQWGLETPYWKVHGLAPVYQYLAPQTGRLVCCLTGIGLGVLVGIQWRANKLNEFAAAGVVLVVNSLFNPYVPIYDLSLLVLALAFIVEAGRRHAVLRVSSGVFPILAACVFFGPHVSQVISRQIGLQIFPLVVLAALMCIAGRLLLTKFGQLRNQPQSPGRPELNGQWRSDNSGTGRRIL